MYKQFIFLSKYYFFIFSHEPDEFREVRRDDVRAASVLQDGAALGFAVNANYLHAGIVLEQSGVTGLRELPHPVGHGQFV